MLRQLAATFCMMMGLFCAPEPARSSEEAPVIMSPEKLAISDADMMLGDPKAPVTIVEYASLSCSHCAAFHNETFPTIKEKYIDTGKVRLVFRNFPFNAPALHGAILAHCAGKEQFFNFVKVLFRTQSDWAFDNNYLPKLENTGKLGGVSKEKFDACLKDSALEIGLIKEKQRAVDELKVQATPSFFINGKLFSGNMKLEMISKEIDAALAKAAAAHGS